MNRSLLVFPLFVLIALLLVKFLHKDEPSYFLWTGKIYTRSDFYDRCKEITESWTKDDALKSVINKGSTGKDHSLLFIKSDSYRNEDIYVFDVKIAFKDSNGLDNTGDILEKQLRDDKILDERFYQQIELQKKLIMMADTADKTILPVKDIISLEHLKYSLKNEVESFRHRLSYSFPSEKIKLIHADNTRSYLISIIISLVAAFVVVVFFRRSKINS